MSRAVVALIIILIAIFGYFAMASVAILIRGVPEEEFVEPSNPDTPSVYPSDANNGAEPAAAGAQE